MFMIKDFQPNSRLTNVNHHLVKMTFYCIFVSDCTLNFLSEKFGFAPSTCCKAFKKVNGQEILNDFPQSFSFFQNPPPGQSFNLSKFEQ